MPRTQRAAFAAAAAWCVIVRLLSSAALAFQPSHRVVYGSSMRETRCWLAPTSPDDEGLRKTQSLPAVNMHPKNRPTGSAIPTPASLLAATAASWVATASVALADDAVELADLPPPYVPAIFAVVLLGGVGWFTASLGNVMDEEASLGLQSGARAKKEMERSRSSYFKKK